MCKVMGIVNVTPDSFSDGGKFNTPEEAIRRAKNLVEEGADIIDIGGESTRPGATPISWEEEWARIEPVLKGLNSQFSTLNFQLSVDTYHPETAERAVAAGATIVNCVYPEPVEAMLELLASNSGVELVIPSKLIDSKLSTLNSKLSTFSSRLYLDPMIGFGTTREEDLALVRSVAVLAKKGRVLFGASRKRIVRALTGEERTDALLGGDVALALWAAAHGASVVRVHDVKEVAQALRVWGKLATGDHYTTTD